MQGCFTLANADLVADTVLRTLRANLILQVVAKLLNHAGIFRKQASKDNCSLWTSRKKKTVRARLKLLNVHSPEGSLPTRSLDSVSEILAPFFLAIP
jgi:hypothetical protein